MTSNQPDPLTFEVVKHALASIGDEMALVILRSAFSPVVRDSMDYSTAVMDKNGAVVAQGLTLAVQLGSFPDVMRHLLKQYADDIHPGDLFICNDPYGAGGQHLPDIYIIKPIFVDETLEGFAATIAHHSDVGGIAPGSVAIHATDIHQEGLRLPIVKLYDQGAVSGSIMKILERNTRNPVHLLGDIRAQIAACRAGENGLTKLVRRYGAEELTGYLEELQAQAERMMRADIALIPDGVYQFTDWIDGVGEAPQRLKIQATVTVDGDHMKIDFTGTSKQVPAAINAPVAMARSSAFCAARCVGSADIPSCEGYMRAIELVVPEGTIINPNSPAACGARGVMGYRTFDAIMGALAQAVPERVVAASEGGPTLFAIGGNHNGSAYTLTEVMVGCWGARRGLDGLDGASNPAANLSNQPIELIESSYPIEIARYGFVADSGGAGEYRGGLAYVREFKLREGEATFTTRADRRDNPPYGLEGGKPGKGSINEFWRGGKATLLPTMPMCSYRLAAGDSFRHVSAGGGGFGPAKLRDVDAVLRDVLEGKVSVRAAEEEYGVSVDLSSGMIDERRTAELREA